MPDESDRTHDTDPLADTQSSDGSEHGRSTAASGSFGKPRVVRAGDTLGRYELLEEVGEGGMATVFRARDRELRREVAVKVLFPHLARRPEVVHRFHREARAAAGLEHANILRVYDVGGADGPATERGEVDPPYIVMELIRGHSLLAEIERRGAMLSEVVACIGAVLADALVVAHAAGIIHRDIKPANVMIDLGRRGEVGAASSRSGGRVLLADFGVARLETEDSLVTKTGALLGTPAYMSPEQATGDTATAKSDLYSLGATLYQLATGTLPYTGTPAKVIAQLASGTHVTAARRRPGVGPELSRVIERLMAIDPNARPANAGEVATELRAIASAGGFGEPADELAAYFADPEKFVAERTPKVVASLLAAADRALAENKLPRAMALADRAAALAPDDPAVNALVQRVTEGGSSSQRRRVLAIVGGAAVLAGGATLGAMQLFGGDDAPALDAMVVTDEAPDDALAATVGDAPVAVRDAAVPSVDAAIVAAVVDAGSSRPRVDARPRTRDAAIVVAPVDAGVPVPVDAAPRVAPVVDAALPAHGFVVIENDTWCEVSIDGVPRGRATKQPLRVEAGTHEVACVQPGTGNKWTRTVEVAPGATVKAEGTMLATIAVTLEVDAQIDGVSHRRGAVVQLRRGRHALVIGGTRAYFDLTRPCRVRSTPEPGCY